MNKYILLLSSLFVSPYLYAESKSEAENELELDQHDIAVYRSPSCGCCGKWVQHLKQHEFVVKDVLVNDMQSLKEKYAVPKKLASCHTAVVDGYIIEGHVPEADIKKLLKKKPEVLGLTVPGMVTGSPGMEMGNRKDPYNVMAFEENGQVNVFQEYQNY